MVYEIEVCRVNCLERNQFLPEAPTCQASRHRDRNVPCAPHPRSSPELLQIAVCSQLKKRFNLEVPHYHDSFLSLLSTICSENLIAFLSQGHSAEPKLIILKKTQSQNYSSTSTQQEPIENIHVEDLASVPTP